MKSYRVVWTEPKVVKVEEWEVPEVGGRQVLVKTRFTLISPGTERAWLLHLPNTPATFPQYPGYCAVGEVLEVGEEVKQFKKGDRVVWAGRHSAHAVVNEDALLPVPSDLPDEEAVFFRLIAIALQGVRKARIELGESVVVLGAGLIGLLALQLAKLSGGFPVIAVDLSEVRLKFAQEVEADFTLQLSEDLNACVSELTDGGAHVVIEATGNPEAIPLAFKLARRMGRVILLGSTGARQNWWTFTLMFTERVWSSLALTIPSDHSLIQRQVSGQQETIKRLLSNFSQPIALRSPHSSPTSFRAWKHQRRMTCSLATT
ncbi:MAG: hypothetical protein DFNUSKGM_000057 [Candidatus Fervidibacter sacchari]